MTISVACGFKWDPDADGSMIPASEQWADGPRRGYGKPVIGYLCYLAEDDDQIWYSFAKWEPPETWGKKWNRPNVPGQFATTRVGRIRCSKGHDNFAPVRGDGSRAMCPYCGCKDVDVDLVKEGSDEFFSMLGDLRTDLEKAVRAAASSGMEFEFPQGIITAKGIPMSSAVDPTIAAKLQAIGFGAKDLKEISGHDELASLKDLHPAMSIKPGIVSGTVDADEAQKGISQSWPVFGTWLKLYVPRPTRREPLQYSHIRF